MKLKFKKISILFLLSFILLISLAMVSAEEISTDSNDLSLSDTSGSIENEPDNNLNLESGEFNSLNQGSNLDDDNNVLESGSQEILNAKNEADSNILTAGDSYTISVNNISANEGSNVNIVANVKNNNVPVSTGRVLFALWTADGTPVGDYADVNNGQGVLNIKLPKASQLSALNWICEAAYYDDNNALRAKTTFLTQIKRVSIPTTVLTTNILGKMGKKVTLVANIYDDNGLKVNTGTVTFTVKGKSYKVNVKNGKASKTITSPFVGIYTVKVKYNGVGAYKSSSGSFKLGSDLKIKTLYYKTLNVKKGAKKYYKFTLTNYFTKKPLKSFKMKFKVKVNKKTWKTYTLKSNSKGVIKWSTKKLAKGTHKVVISSAYKIFKFKLKGKIIVR